VLRLAKLYEVAALVQEGKVDSGTYDRLLQLQLDEAAAGGDR
jgi:hypothetical protein